MFSTRAFGRRRRTPSATILATLAEQLGYKKAVKLLAETLEEEKETDLKLTDLAVGNINQKAQK